MVPGLSARAAPSVPLQPPGSICAVVPAQPAHLYHPQGKRSGRHKVFLNSRQNMLSVPLRAAEIPLDMPRPLAIVPPSVQIEPTEHGPLAGTLGVPARWSRSSPGGTVAAQGRAKHLCHGGDGAYAQEKHLAGMSADGGPFGDRAGPPNRLRANGSTVGRLA